MTERIILLVALLFLPLIPTFWAILDIPRRKFASTKMKIIWFLTVSTLPFFGAVFYFLLARRHTVEAEETHQANKEAR